LKKIRLGVLVSGGGTNLQSIIDHAERGAIDAEIGVVISNVPDAYALKRAERHNIPSLVIDHRKYSTRQKFEKEIIRVLHEYNVELVVLAGFMRVLTPFFIREFPMKIVNIHPALLPVFPGTHVQQQALDYGARFSGCTVHFVDEGVDTGPIIIQAVVPVQPDDTAETLAQRILREEHKIYAQAIQLIAQEKLEICGRRVLIRDHPPLDEVSLINPQYVLDQPKE
jgi:phosphoribosylglycinamide formyltransferase-1